MAGPNDLNTETHLISQAGDHLCLYQVGGGQQLEPGYTPLLYTVCITSEVFNLCLVWLNFC